MAKTSLLFLSSRQVGGVYRTGERIDCFLCRPKPRALSLAGLWEIISDLNPSQTGKDRHPWGVSAGPEAGIDAVPVKA